jgi:hypothetical protein
MDLHQLGEERSIAVHRVVAERLHVDPWEAWTNGVGALDW